ncbi:hypothetical protein Acr_00g0081440 [Actinidia rufa]|uniref:Heparan-alpha-glucosaminide N-acetyltransferase-like protein n=1 Tax=Actinidia rufa TaxID=165716 RepID=A0A7J0DW56_9ERIC|nr:hypothetical protein Acr_00g0081440 [Actinidia rufa]
MCFDLMMLVDDVLAHSPWNGIHLANFVMPFFLFAAGISLALYKKVPDRVDATQKALLRVVKLFFLGVLLQVCDNLICYACALSVVYLGFSYGLFVPDWQLEVSRSTSVLPPMNNSSVYMVRLCFILNFSYNN